MARRLVLKTRSFGAEPGLPDLAGLADWIAGHRGSIADIVTYQLDRSLVPQAEAGIAIPCAGGKFYAERIRQSLAGTDGSRVTGDLHLDTGGIVEDAAGIVLAKSGAWCALPAPHALGITDTGPYDDDEWCDLISGIYRTMMRVMRDTGVAGHVLVADRMDEAELAALHRQKVFFFQPEPDEESLSRLMEFQRQVAVKKEHLDTVFGLTGEYSLQKVFVIDPDPASIGLALSHLDADQVVAGGYCTEAASEYWKDLVRKAVYLQ